MKHSKTKVTICLKPEVLDPQGKAIEGTLHRLGYSMIKDVRVAKVIEWTSSQAVDAKEIEKICKTVLSNPVIEEFSYETLE